MKKFFLILVIFYFIPFARCQNNLEGDLKFYQTDSLGVSRLYFENGLVEKEGSFVLKKTRLFMPKMNLKNGLWSFYYDNGNLKMKGSYKNGKKEGLWEKFNEEGNLLRVVFYRNDRIIDERIYIVEIPLWKDEIFLRKKDLFPTE